MRPTDLRPLSECESNLAPRSIRLSYAMREGAPRRTGVICADGLHVTAAERKKPESADRSGFRRNYSQCQN